MNSIEDINAQIAKYEKKIEDLKKQRKVINFKNFVDKKDLKKMKDIQLEVSYQYRESDEDEYAHWIHATLSVKFTFKDKEEHLTIDYNDEQGYHTESRYIPTITRNELQGTKQAKKILLQNLDFEYQELDEFIDDPDERRDRDWFKIRDMIREING